MQNSSPTSQSWKMCFTLITIYRVLQHPKSIYLRLKYIYFKIYMPNLIFEMTRKGVTADESKSWWFVGRILVIGFRIAKDLTPETISEAWLAKYLKRTKKFVHLNWNRLSYECIIDSLSEEPALSQESNRKLLLSSAVTPFLAIFSIF